MKSKVWLLCYKPTVCHSIVKVYGEKSLQLFYVYIPGQKLIAVLTAEINSISLKKYLFPTTVNLQKKIGHLKDFLFILMLPA